MSPVAIGVQLGSVDFAGSFEFSCPGKTLTRLLKAVFEFLAFETETYTISGGNEKV
jgi:hypothetical protein